MGKKRLVAPGEERPQEEKAKSQGKKESEKVKVPGLKGGQRVVAIQAEPIPEEKKEEKRIAKETPRPPKVRGKKYRLAKAKIEPNKIYPLPEAIKLLKTTSISRFDGSVEAHLNVTDTKVRGEAQLPYFQATAKKVKVADEKLLADLEKGKIDFEILLSAPAFMPKLAKYAKILGPKGLMPNPKNGTILPDPEKALARFTKPSFSFKTEKDQPLIHLKIGQVSQKEKELEENFKALVSAIDPKKIKKAVLKSTMGPAIKVDVSSS